MTPEIISQDEARALFEYRDGVLYWRQSINRSVPAGAIAGALRAEGYRQVSVRRRMYRAHRIIFLMHHGYLPPEVDHINEDKTDNRIANLRAATHQQNRNNTGKPATNTSGVKGVCWDKSCGKWKAQCKISGKNYSLGHFDSIEDAAKVVRAFRETHIKEFANHG